jgi:hypothetical protein
MNRGMTEWRRVKKQVKRQALSDVQGATRLGLNNYGIKAFRRNFTENVFAC